MTKNLDKLKALRIGDQAVFLRTISDVKHLATLLRPPCCDAYGLLLLNLEGVCNPVARVSVLPLVLKFGSETTGFVCLPIQAAIGITSDKS